MARSEKQNLKILYILKLLSEKSDEKHPIPTVDLISYLEQNEIRAERKSIYSDIRLLQDFGYDILNSRAKGQSGYYMASRDFELPELKLLVDLIQSSRFITTKKSEQFIAKIEKLTNEHEAKQLQRQVFVSNRIKSDNETIYYLVDEIHRAINKNHRISFQYVEMLADKKEVCRKNGKQYEISPWALTWNDDLYYMIGYDEEAGMIKHYRVDRMRNVATTDKARCGKEEFTSFDLANYCKKTFRMFSGPERTVRLSFPETLCGVVTDRFGRDISMRKTNNLVYTHVDVMVSNQFFGWISGIGKDIHIEGPEDVAAGYRDYLKELVKAYE